MTSYIQVVTTVDSQEAAEKIAATVLEGRLAACVQISPCTSMYHWRGEVETAAEFLCVMKSRSDLLDALEEAVAAAHPYEVPEIIATEALRCGRAYEGWLSSELRPPRQE
ncbi:MAG: divalent-cation tolerance protein CutA [Desulfobulbaceae bacterium]|jgi:periplasmic divalent cation tolerance protein|nr:divalent-cation tolerance protein CutA [Desulfobulbaceae bacterium]MDY0350527.1 divalent-cation tolerance protein CutA [Desulfobulbaceae bacterium]